MILASTSGAQLWATIAAWVTVGIYVAVALFAYVQIADARDARRAANRPYVFVDFDMSDQPMIWLTLQNVGVTAARNVRFTSEPPMTSTFGAPTAEAPEGLKNMLDKEWPYLPPGKEIRALYDSAIPRLANPPPLPLRYTVTASYDDGRTGERYDDAFVLDIDTYRNLLYTRPKTLDDVVTGMEELAKKLDPGFHVIARDYEGWLIEQQKQREELRQRMAAARARQAQQAPVSPDESPDTKGEDAG